MTDNKLVCRNYHLRFSFAKAYKWLSICLTSMSFNWLKRCKEGWKKSAGKYFYSKVSKVVGLFSLKKTSLMNCLITSDHHFLRMIMTYLLSPLHNILALPSVQHELRNTVFGKINWVKSENNFSFCVAPKIIFLLRTNKFSDHLPL